MQAEAETNIVQTFISKFKHGGNQRSEKRALKSDAKEVQVGRIQQEFWKETEIEKLFHGEIEKKFFEEIQEYAQGRKFCAEN